MDRAAIVACPIMVVGVVILCSTARQGIQRNARCFMSALPPKADIGTQSRDVRYVPKADKVHRSKMVLCDHLVGADDERLRNCQSKRFRCLEIKNQLEFCWLLDRKISRFRAFEYFVRVGHCPAEKIR